MGGSCTTHDSCNSGICVNGACSPCVGNSCTGTKYCWNGKCLAHKDDRLKDHLACGTCPSGYKCATVEDMLEKGRACVKNCHNPMKGGPNCNERCPDNSFSCENGVRRYNFAQSTYCKNGIFVRNPFPNTPSHSEKNSQPIINGVLVGYCLPIDGSTTQQRCNGDMTAR